ncbi:putative phosphatidic acid phosphohydrolase [Clavispora lusitaniae]|uniref:Phosphatidic acid phosphohydrolase n=1 Tax=Clavispora lusitaniae TaxID=36911 RepID=A0ACD0WHH2_CLALS|nr:putative phosphatidic acid phosphohydrolase [Clavispora lusitaniae]QFZ32286.1 putative phosphatidic acid phosphohydrolase [Clavispora lusitaniae]QFZ37955.1 putative phosphatidic acid phosphohydrolase [Clavispora lusitaniae]QFZ43638.1 putative phosphatidic acid phosphohydrolase [Clavispora lusitaniae]QFZ49315.1 putative phosphatidic acid phosphohydrolase [Clavispora lusitaniae]
MQYVGKMGDYVYNQWNSLNPATLSGAIDIIVIEQPDGSLHCSPWHVRFGLFQIIKPSEKKIVLYVNDIKTDLPMKLGEGGEAFFVFETDSRDVSQSVVTSPVVSPEKSPSGSPESTPGPGRSEPDLLDLNQSAAQLNDIDSKIKLEDSPAPEHDLLSNSPSSRRSTQMSRIAFERAKQITKKLNIPSKIDVNGDMVLDMDGYQPNSQKNIDSSDELLQKVFLKEMNTLLNGKEYHYAPENAHEHTNDDEEYKFLQGVIMKDKDGKLRIINRDTDLGLDDPGNPTSSDSSPLSEGGSNSPEPTGEQAPVQGEKVYIKTLRLTSDQLKSMNLNYGRNKIKFKSTSGSSQVEADLYLWKSTTPIVISDIDGTITKSDALGHVLNMFGKDWTHPGVAKLFSDISRNGYNILYLTARSAGQADTTRQYLHSIVQDGYKLPKGPVILSPDRTIAALKREIILKKPEVFKMACLRDIKSLFFSKQGEHPDIDDDRTPFYAGFGNRITDAISYKSVKIPSHRIFTINPVGEVHMELLELAGYRSSYLHIGELVDCFFPPLKYISVFNDNWDEKQLNQYMDSKSRPDDAADLQGPESPRSIACPGSPRSISSYPEEVPLVHDEKFTDLNYWREPIPNIDDLSDMEEDGTATSPAKSPPHSPKLLSSPRVIQTIVNNSHEPASPTPAPKNDRPLSMSFNSPLKSFMMRGKPQSAVAGQTEKVANEDEEDEEDEEEDMDEYEDDYTDDYDDDYTGEEDEDEDDDDYDEEEEEENEDVDVDYQDDYEEDEDHIDEVDDEDIDQEAEIDMRAESKEDAEGWPRNRSTPVHIVKATDVLRDLKLN